MVRVSSFGQQQILIQHLMQNQVRLFDDQRQVTTGKIADDFAGLAGKTNTSLGARSFFSRTESYQSTIKTVRGKMDAYDVQLNGILDSARDFEQFVRISIGQSTAEGFSEMLDQTYGFTSTALNTSIGGSYIFAGTKTGVAPIQETNLTNMVALPAVGDVFANSLNKFVGRIADGVEMEFGVLASDVGQDLFTVLKDIKDFNTGPSGPLQGNLTQTQVDFLKAKLLEIGTAIEGIQKLQVRNGLGFKRLDVVESQHADTAIFLEKFISDIEDVNMAEAISNLNKDQLVLEASYRSIGQLGNLSLLKFL
mgnify:CR=1 FL=1